MERREFLKLGLGVVAGATAPSSTHHAESEEISWNVGNF